MTTVARRFAVGSDQPEVLELASGLGNELHDKQVLWIDSGLEQKELEQVDEALGLNGVVRSVIDISRVGLRFLDGAIRITVAGLEAHEKASRPTPVLVHIVAVPNAVVTVHKGAVLGLEDPVAAVAGDPRFGDLNAGTFVGLLLDGMLNGYYRELEGIERVLDKIDERALGREPTEALLSDLVSARRRIAVLRRTLAPQREVYAALSRPIGDNSSPIGAPWPELTSRLERTIDAVDQARVSVLGSFDIVMTRTGQHTNDIMRVLTVISSVLLPAVVVGGVMGMNFHPSLFDDPSLFYVVVALMVGLATMTLLLARRRGWL
jgi:magnesium transporter